MIIIFREACVSSCFSFWKRQFAVQFLLLGRWLNVQLNDKGITVVSKESRDILIYNFLNVPYLFPLIVS